jgi:predicted nuclease of predicted toxin-antitoxin system
MQFKLDENLPPAVKKLLRSLGHDVITVYVQGLQSRTDPEVLAACQGEARVLLSLNLDFSNILVFPPERYAGLIVLRLRKPGPRAVLSLLQRVLEGRRVLAARATQVASSRKCQRGPRR